MSAVTLGLLLVAAAAQGGPLPANIVDLERLEGTAYVMARDAEAARLAQDSTRRQVLAGALAELRWGTDTWRPGVVAESLMLRVAEPAIARPLDRLQGIDPQHYQQRRWPEPEVGRELIAARLPGVILIERYLRRQAEVAQSSPEQRAALAVGLLRAIGRSSHPAAPLLLREVALAADAPLGERRVAAASLGATQAPLAGPTLRSLAATDDESLVIAAAVGAARLHDAAGLALLRDLLRRSSSPDVERAALIGLGGFANARAWRPHERPGAESLRREAAQTLASALRAGSITPELDAAFLRAVGAAAHPTLRAALSTLAEDPRVTPAARDLADRALRRARLADRRR